MDKKGHIEKTLALLEGHINKLIEFNKNPCDLNVFGDKLLSLINIRFIEEYNRLNADRPLPLSSCPRECNTVLTGACTYHNGNRVDSLSGCFDYIENESASQWGYECSALTTFSEKEFRNLKFDAVVIYEDCVSSQFESVEEYEEMSDFEIIDALGVDTVLAGLLYNGSFPVQELYKNNRHFKEICDNIIAYQNGENTFDFISVPIPKRGIDKHYGYMLNKCMGVLRNCYNDSNYVANKIRYKDTQHFVVWTGFDGYMDMMSYAHFKPYFYFCLLWLDWYLELEKEVLQ